MSTIAEIRARRQKLADVLADEEYRGIRDLVERLYPDRAHFIYELLQNAEDAEAHHVGFELSRDKLRFEHDGQPFTEQDVLGITNIGMGTKIEDSGKIGQFGIGFKAVFAYTETPRIHCRTYSFEIQDLVMPQELPIPVGIGNVTRFEFPFNNRKKSGPTALDEVRSSLRELAGTTLLFLHNIEEIRWREDAGPWTYVRRVNHDGPHYEIQTRTEDTAMVNRLHFLRFSRECRFDGHTSLRVALAFEMNPIPNADLLLSGISKPGDQMRIVPATPARVAVYFPCEKETSGLRFHLHAPFATPVSRDSIEQTDRNTPLFAELATLASDSLVEIRDLGLLTPDFLGVLPNPQDDLPARYQPIRSAIITAMRKQPLTPTHDKSHAPAERLVQSKASFKSLFPAEDLAVLCGNGESGLDWAVRASQRNSNQDRFLEGLGMREFGASELEDFLQRNLTDGMVQLRKEYYGTSQVPSPAVVEWFGKHTALWHQRLYALLFQELGGERCRITFAATVIVRTEDGGYRKGSESFFHNADIAGDPQFPCVDHDILKEGERKEDIDNARQFLRAIGVRDVGEAERVEALLRSRYSPGEHFQPSVDDIGRFVKLVESQPKTAALFKDRCIFKLVTGKWGTPSHVWLDSPYKTTGLDSWYAAIGDKAKAWALADDYRAGPIDPNQLGQFAESVGARSRLEIEEAQVSENPERLWVHVRGRRSCYAKREDWQIPLLPEALKQPTVELARLVWQTMRSQGRGRLTASYYHRHPIGFAEAGEKLGWRCI